MASLVLLLSELLRHGNADQLIPQLPLSASSSTSFALQAAFTNNNGAPPSSTVAENSSKFNKEVEEFQEDLPRISIDLVWP